MGLSRRLVGMFRILDPDDKLEQVYYGWIVVGDGGDVFYTSHDEHLSPDKFVSQYVLEEQYSMDVYDAEEDETSEEEFDIEVMILNQNTMHLHNLSIESWRELRYAGDYGHLEWLEQLALNKVKELQPKEDEEDGVYGN